MIRSVIYHALNNALGNSVGAVRPLILQPSDTLPAITYQVEVEASHTFEGRSDLSRCQLEINIYAPSLDTAHQLTGAVETALLNATGRHEQVIVYKPQLTRIIDQFINEPGEYRVNCQFSFHYKPIN